jgi:hypothetical protein
MFITIGSIAQYVAASSGDVLLVTGQGRQATAMEAAECVNRMVVNGDARMEEANEDFIHHYGRSNVA